MKEYSAITTEYINHNASTSSTGTDRRWLRGRLPSGVALQAQLDDALGAPPRPRLSQAQLLRVWAPRGTPSHRVLHDGQACADQL